jgi:hypothetical protein
MASQKFPPIEEPSPEFWDWFYKVNEEEEQRIGPLLRAMVLEDRSLPLSGERKARERTSSSSNKDHKAQSLSQASE